MQTPTVSEVSRFTAHPEGRNAVLAARVDRLPPRRTVWTVVALLWALFIGSATYQETRR